MDLREGGKRKLSRKASKLDAAKSMMFRDVLSRQWSTGVDMLCASLKF